MFKTTQNFLLLVSEKDGHFGCFYYSRGFSFRAFILHYFWNVSFVVVGHRKTFVRSGCLPSRGERLFIICSRWWQSWKKRLQKWVETEPFWLCFEGRDLFDFRSRFIEVTSWCKSSLLMQLKENCCNQNIALVASRRKTILDWNSAFVQ